MNTFTTHYRALNDLQRRGVDTIDGPLLVLAGPGTGKTQLLSVRAAAILDRGATSAEHILILTYTTTAVKAMRERLATIIGPAGYDITVTTFHSFANAVIQDSEEAVLYVGEKIQMDDVERVKAIEYAIDHTPHVEALRPFRAPYLYQTEIANRISELKRDGVTSDMLIQYLASAAAAENILDQTQRARLEAFSRIYASYETLKDGKNPAIFDERGRYDFDDMILMATNALRQEDALRKRYQEHYTHVMVDEFQDTNGAQLELLFTLLDYPHPNLCCVGDDDQSIYRFQGASVGNFKFFLTRFPKAAVISLTDNYRSTKELIDASRSIISLIPIPERMGEKALVPHHTAVDQTIEFKECSTTEEEILFIIDRIRERARTIATDKTRPADERAHPYNTMAILVRKRNDIAPLIDACLRSGIPYATDGKEDISGEKRVKQMLDVLELAAIDPGNADGRDLALYRVLSADYLAIPLPDVLALIAHTHRRKLADPSASLIGELLTLASADTKKVPFPVKSAPRLRRAARAIATLVADAHTRPVHSILLDFIHDAGIFHYLLEHYDKNRILQLRELRALTSFVTMIKKSDIARPGLRLADLRAELKVRVDHDMALQGDLVTASQDGVRIFTAHGSKGQEFETVFIPFCLHNKNWPSRPIPARIVLPSELFKTKERIHEKEQLQRLFLQDETRLFYVAMTRAKSHLVITASTGEETVASSYVRTLPLTAPNASSPDERTLMTRSLQRQESPDQSLRGTERILRDMIHALSLNPTRLNTYLACPRRFFYNDVLKLPGSKKQSLIFGNCVHKALEETYAAFKKTGTFPPFTFFRGAFEQELRFQGPDEAIMLRCLSTEQMGKIEGWYARTALAPVMPLGLEKKLITTIGDGIPFTGKYDKIEWEDASHRAVRIIDYKTGKPDDHLKAIAACNDIASDSCDAYLRQLVAYRLLFERDKKESHGRRASHGTLVFIEPVTAPMVKLGYKKGDYATATVAITDAQVRQLEALIIAVWKRIQRLDFDPLPRRDEKLCGRCDFCTLCWG